MSFMADYCPEHDEQEREEHSDLREAIQRWTVVVVFMTAVLLVRAFV